MSRPDISMTDAEVEAFLAGRGAAVVAALGPDGWPVGAVARVARQDHMVHVDPRDVGPLREALDDGAPVCCLFEESPTYFTIRGVTVHGRVRTLAADGALEVEVERLTSFDFGKLPSARP